METKIISIEKTNESQNVILKSIESKLDHVIECKADKEEVNKIRDKINSITYGSMTSLVILLITAIGFLLRYTLFK